MRLLDSLGPIGAALTFFSTLPTITALTLDPTSQSSIRSTAKHVVEPMIQWYTGGVPGQVVSGTPGYLAQLPEQAQYYWWETGAMCGILMDYYYYTGDNSYNNLVETAMMFQVGPNEDFMTPNVSKQEGNDDQMAWGFAAMTAAEYKFPNPPPDKPQWLALAQGVWNSQQLRWDNSYCGGGLRWQIFTLNLGYDYKNTPSNAGFMNLGARLYAYTGNQTYADWATKTWNWMYELKYIGGYRGYSVFDGGGIDSNCSQVNNIQWTYSAGMLLNGCAVMWNATGDQVWYDRAMGIWNSSLVFFNKDRIMFEAACENNQPPRPVCDNDQLAFKGLFARFIYASTKWLPDLWPQAQPYMQASAVAAAQQCDGTANVLGGPACGFKWTQGSQWDNSWGWGQQFDALEIIQGQLIESAAYPVTHVEGISRGDPSAGTGGDFAPGPPILTRPITTGDKAGAGILTAFVIITWCSAIYWMY